MYYTLVVALLIIVNAFGHRTKGLVIIPEIKIVNKNIITDITIEGGVVKDEVIFNATVVYGQYPIDNKNYSNVVTLYQNCNGMGPSLTLTDKSLTYNDLSNYNFTNVISSIQLLDLNYIINAYTQPNFTGYCWTFGSPIMVYDLQDYGINDKVQSILLINKNNNHVASIIYAKADFRGSSLYVANNLNHVNLCGTLPINTLSSIIILPYASFFYWANIDNNFYLFY